MRFPPQDFLSAEGTARTGGDLKGQGGAGGWAGLCCLEYCLDTSFPLESEVTPFDPHDSTVLSMYFHLFGEEQGGQEIHP